MRYSERKDISNTPDSTTHVFGLTHSSGKKGKDDTAACREMGGAKENHHPDDVTPK